MMATMAVAQVNQIRDYEQADAPAIARLFYETVRSVNRADYSKEQVEAWVPAIPDAGEWHDRMTSRKTLVAEEDGEVVGFCELEKDGHLDMFYVRKDAVGRGIGPSLYEVAERAARRWNLGRIFTEASVTARPFFERRGFRVLGARRVSRQGVELTNFALEKSLRTLDGEGEQGML